MNLCHQSNKCKRQNQRSTTLTNLKVDTAFHQLDTNRQSVWETLTGRSWDSFSQIHIGTAYQSTVATITHFQTQGQDALEASKLPNPARSSNECLLCVNLATTPCRFLLELPRANRYEVHELAARNAERTSPMVLRKNPNLERGNREADKHYALGMRERKELVLWHNVPSANPELPTSISDS